MINLNINENLNSQLKLVSILELQELANNCHSWNEFIDAVGMHHEELYDGDKARFRESIRSLNIDCSHFTRDGKKPLSNYSIEELQEIVNSSKDWNEISEKLNFNKRVCRNYFRKVGVDYTGLSRVAAFLRKKWFEYTKEELQEAVKVSTGWEDLYKRLQLNLNKDSKKAFKEKVKSLNIDYSHFPHRGGPRTRPDRKVNVPYEKIKETALNSNSFKETYDKLGIPLDNGVYRRKLKKEGINDNFFKEKGYKVSAKRNYSEEDIKEAISTSKNWLEASQKLGHDSVISDLYDQAILLNIDYSHFYLGRYEVFKSLDTSLIKEVISQKSTWEEVCRELNIPLYQIEIFRSYVVSLNLKFNNLRKNLKEPSDSLILEISKDFKTKKDIFRRLLSLGYNITYASLRNILDSINEVSSNLTYKRLYKDIIFTEEELREAIKTSTSWYEVCEKLGYPKDVWNQKPRNLANSLGIDYSHFDYKQLNSLSKHTDDEIREAIKSSISFREAAKKLGFDYFSASADISSYAKEHNIDISHFYRTGDGILDELKKLPKEQLQAMVDASFSWNSLCRSLGFKGASSVFKDYLIEQGVDLSKYKTQVNWTPDLLNQRLDEIYGEGNVRLVEEPKVYASGRLLFRCKEHGLFRRTLANILDGDGCSQCRGTLSVGEHAIKTFFDKNGFIAEIDFISQKKFPDCRYTYPLSFDFYIPSKNICIEFQGAQHLHPVRYDDSQTEEEILEQFKYQLERDRIKREYCENNNIKLIEVFKVKEIPEKLGFLFEDKTTTNN